MSEHDTRGEAPLADFVPMLDGRTRLLVRRGWEDAAEHLADPDGVAVDEELAGGRVPCLVTTLPGGARVVIRRYRRGGVMRWVNRTHYFGGNRAFDELRATERARAGGVRAPVVVAAIERPGRLAGYRAWLATELVPHAQDLAAWLHHSGADEVRRVAVLAEAGRQIGLMHAAGVAHPDVNLRNLLVAGDLGAEVYLIDFDRADVSVRAVSRGRRERDLRRLARSARKLAVIVSPDEWAAFRDGYGEGWPDGLDLSKPPKRERKSGEAGEPADSSDAADPADDSPDPDPESSADDSSMDDDPEPKVEE
ncbi:MAG TPA: lipopolysaccharide kinase InaA family protein [Longimicrobium sp.]|nr:lipopolysaccharide kinase InaA family protein [Longimicrobium sp.]